ncbi:hypothetical protein HanRHA438_Chr15g0704021 [Helianthus annuus]|nr:hypothetical protein HanIR_Chr15g0751631 [Helianthus annuus]KAJ0844577.1 hypothetical protein HanRHA438_Chr15g0704021 [Helianthus annuus]
MAACADTSFSLSSRSLTKGGMILVSVARNVLAKFPIDWMLGIRRSDSPLLIILSNLSTTSREVGDVGLKAERLRSV